MKIEVTQQEKNSLKYIIPTFAFGIFLIVTGFTDTFDDVVLFFFPQHEEWLNSPFKFAFGDQSIEGIKYKVTITDGIGTNDNLRQP